MIFFKEVPPAAGVAGSDKQPKQEFAVGRFVGGVVLVGIVFAAAYLAKVKGWPEGSAALLDLAKTAGGGVIGILIGEKGAKSA